MSHFINCLYMLVTNTKAYATLVIEDITFILAMYCCISFLFLINVILVNTIEVIIFGNSIKQHNVWKSEKNFNSTSTLYSATILTDTIVGSRIFFCYSLVVNMEKANFTNFENSYILIENSYKEIFFFGSGDQAAKKIF